jgi:hypothetical protein
MNLPQCSTGRARGALAGCGEIGCGSPASYRSTLSMDAPAVSVKAESANSWCDRKPKKRHARESGHPF